ncbi:hypothetical protein [Limosilactobacillus reuteri]|uniref:hypothetical protein n=1 Tax=Limosilactobacillus reuteri TaxID=1598 RepID=UPI001E548D25|nr:hypothetical protein [Limosilactobacillus reuteri]MCC4487028.1 hypothetical protein [Limosilactobacillus reuteri]UFK69220.1 hypothetical protein IVR12_02331 [Limosilactobacillus reuteri]
MAKDYLFDAAKSAEQMMGKDLKKENPYKKSREKSRAAQIRVDKLKMIKFISSMTGRNIIDITDDLLQIGLNDPRYKKYQKIMSQIDDLKNN